MRNLKEHVVGRFRSNATDKGNISRVTSKWVYNTVQQATG